MIPGFVGVEYWGSGERTFTEFKKQFSRRIAPAEMKGIFMEIKKEYKKKHSK